MSRPDIAARGLAASAVRFNEELSGAQGAASIGYSADMAGTVLRSVAGRLSDIGVSPEDFGALGDGSQSDDAALAAFAQTLAQAGEGISRLGAKSYAVGGGLTPDSFRWSGSNGGLIGRGMGRTILRNVNPAGGRAFEFGGSCSHAYFADMTFDGGFGSGAANDLEHIIFNRCRFTTRPGIVLDAMKLVADNMSGGIRSLFFIDCEFTDAGRMNLEVQNHRNDGTCRYADIHLVRPRIIRAGRAAPTFGMGMSFSGKGDHVTINSPYFDGNSGPQLENAGCDRLLMRDAKIRAATAPVDVPAISFSGRSMAYNANAQCAIDGLTLVRAVGDSAGRPALRSELSFGVSQSLSLRRMKLGVRAEAGTNGRHVMTFSGTGLDDAGQPNVCGPVDIEQCDLFTDAINRPAIAFNTMKGAQRVIGNTITNDNDLRVGPLVAAYAQTGGSAYTVQLSANRMQAAIPHSQRSFAFRNNAAVLNVSEDNEGMPVRFRAVTAVPAGAVNGPLVTHGLPNQGLQVSARPLGRTWGGGVPYGTMHSSATRMRANLDSAPSAAVTVELDLTNSF